MKVTVDPDDLKRLLIAIHPSSLTDTALNAYGRLWGAAMRREATAYRTRSVAKAPKRYRIFNTARPDDKIAAIKCMRALFALGLKEAKDIVDSNTGFELPPGHDLDIVTWIAREQHSCTVAEV